MDRYRGQARDSGPLCGKITVLKRCKKIALWTAVGPWTALGTGPLQGTSYTTDSTLSVRDIHRQTPSQSQPAARNELDNLKEIFQVLRISFTEFRAEAADREARYLTKIRLLPEKVSSLEPTTSSIEQHGTERDEKLTKK